MQEFAPNRVGPGIVALRRGVGEKRELPRIPDGQRAQDEAVDEREDRGVRADSERQRKHGDRRHDRRCNQLPDGDADIVDISAARPGTRAFRQLEKRRRVERVERDPSRLVVGCAAADCRRLQLGEVTREFVDNIERESAPFAIGAIAYQCPPLPASDDHA
jgi:hypothetical protein